MAFHPININYDKTAMDDQLLMLAQERYSQKEFLNALFDLALSEQWFDLQHMLQHDMAKAILADYSNNLGHGFLDTKIFYDHWEDVIEIGWQIFCEHAGMSRQQVKAKLSQLHETI
jgi:hypothetical protein